MQCNFWVWCASRNGCDEGGDFNGRYPYRGCELSHMPPNTPVQQWERGPLYSSISSGFITGAPDLVLCFRFCLTVHFVRVLCTSMAAGQYSGTHQSSLASSRVAWFQSHPPFCDQASLECRNAQSYSFTLEKECVMLNHCNQMPVHAQALRAPAFS